MPRVTHVNKDTYTTAPKLKAIKVSSMGYDIVDEKGDFIAYAKKTGFEKYRLSDGMSVRIGVYKSVEACINRLSK